MSLVFKILLIFCLGFVTSLLFAGNAFAYLDPGTGSYIFQIVVAGLLGAMLSIRIFWTRIKLFLKNLFGKKNS